MGFVVCIAEYPVRVAENGFDVACGIVGVVQVLQGARGDVLQASALRSPGVISEVPSGSILSSAREEIFVYGNLSVINSTTLIAS